MGKLAAMKEHIIQLSPANQGIALRLAVPDDMIPQLIEWGNTIVGFSDPELSQVLVDSDEAQKYKHLPFRSPVSQEIFEYGRQLAAETAARPKPVSAPAARSRPTSKRTRAG